MRDLSALLRLDPFRPQTVLTTPFREHWAQPNDVEEGPLAHHAPDHGTVVVVEVAVDGDPAGFRKRDRLFDLAALEILLPERRDACHSLVAGTGTRASAQIGLNAHTVQGRSECSGRNAKSPAMMRDVAAAILASTA